MATSPYALKNDYAASSPPSAADLNRRANVVAAQIPGVLSALGPGVIEGLLVTKVSDTFYAAVGEAFVEHIDGHLVYVRTETSTVISDYVPGEVNYAHLELVTRAAEGDPDSEEGDAPSVRFYDIDEIPGAILLAEVSAAGVVTDRRPFNRLALLLQRMAQAEADIGYNPTERAKGSLASRLNALLGDGEEEAVIIAYLTQLKWSEADTRLATDAIEAKIAAAIAAYDASQQGGTIPQQPLMSLYAHNQAKLIIELRKTRTLAAENFEGAYIVANVGGDGTADTTDHVALTNLTKTDRGWIP